MFKLTSNLAAQTAAGFVGAIMAVALTFGAFTPMSAHAATDAEIAQLCVDAAAAGIPVTTGIFAALCAGTSTTTVVTTTATGNGYIYHPNVDYFFANNMRMGARGEEVRQLQIALNDSAYPVASTGAGSPGLETTYFGPATHRAVIAFQTAQNIQPNIGNFYPLTRAEFNRKGNVVVTTPTTPTTPVSGDGLVVSEGNSPSDDVVAPGQNLVAFTTIVLTANEDASIDEIHVEVLGEDSDSDDAVAQVVLMTVDGIVIDSDAPDTNEVAELDLSGLDLDAGESITLIVAANIDAGTNEDGQSLELEVVAVDAGSVDVSGLPVSGAEHIINDSIDLETYKFDLTNEGDDYNVGEEEALLATIDIDNNNNDDPVFVQVIAVEHIGTADVDDLDNVMLVDEDGNEYDLDSTDGDILYFIIGGLEVEEGDDMEFELVADIDSGAGDNIEFDVDDLSVDVQIIDHNDRVISEDGSYASAGGSASDILAGDASVTDSSEVSSTNIPVGGSEVELSAFEATVEGEDITGDVTITILAASVLGTSNADIEPEDVFIADENGNVIADADSIDTSGAPTFVAEFDDFTLEVGDDVVYYILADIGDDVQHDDDYTVVDINFDNFEGDDTGEDTEINGTDTSAGTETVTLGETQTVKGANLVVSVNSVVAESDVTDETDMVELAVIQLDATDAGEDITVEEIELDITLAGATFAEEVENCELFDDANENGTYDVSVSDDFDFTAAALTEAGVAVTVDNFVVEAGESQALSLQCDVSNAFLAADTITVTLTEAVPATVPATPVVDADAPVSSTVNIALGANAGATVTIVTGTLVDADDAEAEDATTVVSAAEVALGTVELDSDEVEGILEELELIATNPELLEAQREVQVWADGVHVADAFFTGATTTVDTWKEDVDITDGKTILEFVAVGIADAIPGALVEGNMVAVNINAGTDMIVDGDVFTAVGTTLAGVAVYSAAIDVTVEDITAADIADDIIMKFAITVEAGSDDVDVATLAATALEAGTGTSGSAAPTLHNGNSYSDAEGNVAMAATVTLSEGETEYFVVKGANVLVDDPGSVQTTVALAGLISVNTVAISPVEDEEVNSSEEIVYKYTN